MMWNGMEHQTLTSLRSIVLQEKTIIAHELSHSWWGDLVTPKTWNDLWINEGLATYSENLAELGKNRNAMGQRLSRDCNWGRPLNSPDPGDLFDESLVYRRGAIVMHHLRTTLGEGKFWPALQHYRARFAYGNAGTADLKAAFQESSGKDLGPFFNRFVYGTGLPGLRITAQIDNHPGLQSHLTLNYTRTDGYSIPDVCYARIKYTDGTTEVLFFSWSKVGAGYTRTSSRQFSGIEMDPYQDYPGNIDVVTKGKQEITGDTDTTGRKETAQVSGPTDSGYSPSGAMNEELLASPGILSIAQAGGGLIRIEFQTPPGSYFQLEAADPLNLTNGWVVIVPQTKATQPSSSYLGPAGSGARIFRVVYSGQ